MEPVLTTNHKDSEDEQLTFPHLTRHDSRRMDDDSPSRAIQHPYPIPVYFKKTVPGQGPHLPPRFVRLPSFPKTSHVPDDDM